MDFTPESDVNHVPGSPGAPDAGSIARPVGQRSNPIIKVMSLETVQHVQSVQAINTS